MMEKQRSNTIIWMNDKRHPPRKNTVDSFQKIPTTTIASHSTATKKQFINSERLKERRLSVSNIHKALYGKVLLEF